MSNSNQEDKKESKGKTYQALKVHRTKTNILTFSGNRKGQKSIRIYPGITALSGEQVKQIMEDPSDKKLWDELSENGVHKIIKGKTPVGEPIQGDLSSLTVPEAKKAIAHVESVKQLNVLQMNEQQTKARQGVLDAIETRINELKSNREANPQNSGS